MAEATVETAAPLAEEGPWFGRLVDLALRDPGRPLTEALGLTAADLAALVACWTPERRDVLRWVGTDAGTGEDALEEPDVRAYLLECRAGRDEPTERRLAALIARRCRYPNHLWQDLGCKDRNELNALIGYHFPELRRRNASDMKWKKFIYRELCRRMDALVCKAPTCDACCDFSQCFGSEAGKPLI